MKNRVDPFIPKILDKFLSNLQGWEKQVIHMVRMFAMSRNHRLADIILFSPTPEIFIIVFPNFPASRLDTLPILELRQEKTSQHVRRKVTRSNLHPAVFIHQAAEKFAAIRPLFPDDLRVFDQVRIIDKQRTALSAGDVLGFVETLRREFSEGAQVFAFVFAKQSVGVVFNDRKIIFPADGKDLIHLAAHTSIMDRNNRPGPLCDNTFQQAFIEIQGIRPNIDKNWFGTAEDKRVDGGNKSE